MTDNERAELNRLRRYREIMELCHGRGMMNANWIEENFNEDGSLKGEGRWRAKELHKAAMNYLEAMRRAASLLDVEPSAVTATGDAITVERLLESGFVRDGEWMMRLQFQKPYGDDTATFTLICGDVANILDTPWEIGCESAEAEYHTCLLPCEPQTMSELFRLLVALGWDITPATAEKK